MFQTPRHRPEFCRQSGLMGRAGDLPVGGSCLTCGTLMFPIPVLADLARPSGAPRPIPGYEINSPKSVWWLCRRRCVNGGSLSSEEALDYVHRYNEPLHMRGRSLEWLLAHSCAHQFSEHMLHSTERRWSGMNFPTYASYVKATRYSSPALSPTSMSGWRLRSCPNAAPPVVYYHCGMWPQ